MTRTLTAQMEHLSFTHLASAVWRWYLQGNGRKWPPALPWAAGNSGPNAWHSPVHWAHCSPKSWEPVVTNELCIRFPGKRKKILIIGNKAQVKIFKYNLLTPTYVRWHPWMKQKKKIRQKVSCLLFQTNIKRFLRKVPAFTLASF